MVYIHLELHYECFLFVCRASFVVNEDGSKVMLSYKNKTQREAIAKRLLTPGSHKKAVIDCKQVNSFLCSLE